MRAITNKKQVLCWALLAILYCSCQTKEYADKILFNADIYSPNQIGEQVDAIAIKGQYILKLGSSEELSVLEGPETEMIDIKNNFLMPGFIEGHGHFLGIGNNLINLDFLKSKNWQEIVSMVGERVKQAAPGEWIEGRGWHQEKWDSIPIPQVHGYPYHDDLSAISQDNPVILFHASGHSLFANKKAMQLAGISPETPDPVGGAIVKNSAGEPIGVFEERAMGPIRTAYQAYLDQLSPEDLEAKWQRAIVLAQEECLKKGITSFQDAGSSFLDVDRYKKLAEEGKLNLRLWAMLRHSFADMDGNLDGFPIINSGDYFFTCKALKSEVDGALGAFGAWLLKAYNDKPGFVGQNTTPISEVDNIANLAIQHNMQLCVHAIGDRANREVLNIFENTFKANPDRKDLRWRIEHAQHLAPADIPRFKELGVIASMQGIHCTSDAPFVVKRLGEERARLGAYAWRSLLDNGVLIANGTDAPVEDVDPLASFYASVTRKRTDTEFAFFSEQSMTRAEAVYSYTLGNAYAAFEEKLKGSLEEGKFADIVVLSKNLINCKDEEILATKVLKTIVGGEIKYQVD